MKYLKISVGLVWLLLNIGALALAVGYRQTSGYCVEQTPSVAGTCNQVRQYGWPKSYLTSDQAKIRLNENNLRSNSLLYLLFLAPSLAVAFGIGKILDSN